MPRTILHHNPKVEKIDLSKLEKAPVDKSWYEQATATPIANLPGIRDLFQKIENDNPAAFFGLYSNHLDAYANLWGKHSFCYKSEYLWKVWAIKLSDDENLLLLSAKGGGSCFEVSGPGCLKWPPVLSGPAFEKLKQVILTINHDLGKAKRSQFENGHG
ncbi:hypothetical protein RBE51_20520 [Pseudomonas taiwanensis]|uniref:hypothetical protein n=1 Tax=Pseudomonas taiwanensis TaxID=470150 RepID=UPI0028DD45C9|nr:hypothetical protein [Pseudomonas taiwanensis]MDT8925180.1 hypothetical protein [Pseudomonas taiwanensis]